MFTLLKRIFRLGWMGFSRDGGVVAATIFVLVLTIYLVTSLFLLREAGQFLISRLEEKVDISVYFKEEASELEIMNFRKELSDVPEVRDVQYISKEQALKIFVQRHKEDPILMKSLEEVAQNPFLASLNIKATDPNQYETIANFLENSLFDDLIEKVDYYQRKPVIDRIFSLTTAGERFGIILSILLIILSFLIVLNTIRLAIYSSREEIEIQKLVGASNWFIRGPFLAQGIIAGLISAFLSLLILTLTCWTISPKIEFLFPDLNIWAYFTNSLSIIILIQVSTGILVGIVSSTVAIKKYLET